MNIFGSKLFSRKWFCNHKNFPPTNFWWKFLVQTYSLGNVNFWWKYMIQYYLQGNDFATTNTVLMKMFYSHLIPREWFCNHKNFDNKLCYNKFCFKTCFREDDFATLKKFPPNNLWWKFLVQTYSRGNDFEEDLLNTLCTNYISLKFLSSA